LGFAQCAATLRRISGSAVRLLHCREFTLDVLTERPHKRFISEALRHPVKATVELVRLEELIPEQQAQQTTPECVLGMVDFVPLPPQRPGDACFRIAPPIVVNCDG
jgi:hypothetical protein